MREVCARKLVSIYIVEGLRDLLLTALRFQSKDLPAMRTALTCALLAISFLGSPCSSTEDGGERESGVETTTQSLYERYYRNHSGLCGKLNLLSYWETSLCFLKGNEGGIDRNAVHRDFSRPLVPSPPQYQDFLHVYRISSLSYASIKIT